MFLFYDWRFNVLKDILVIKNRELANFFDSLSINSDNNKILFKTMFFLIFSILCGLIIFVPKQFLSLFSLLNITILNADINIIFIVLSLSMLASNKKIISLFKTEFFLFYRSAYLYTFFYIKEKCINIISLIFIEYLLLQSLIFSMISFFSFIVSIIIFIVVVSLNIVHLTIVFRYTFPILLIKKYFYIAVYCCFLLLCLLDSPYLNGISNVILLNIPLVILVSSLFINSEMIFINPSYQQLLFMFKFLDVPFIEGVKHTILYKQTIKQYSLLIAVTSILFLFFNNTPIFNLLYYILNSIIAYALFLYIIYKITITESYNRQRKYFYYFFVMELLLFIAVLNIMIFRRVNL